MPRRLLAVAAGLIAATFSIAATAMPGGETAVKPGTYPMDCSKAQDKARCAALNEKIPACRDEIDDAWRECMYGRAANESFTAPTPRDCTTARNRPLCEAHGAALRACKDKQTRAEHRSCVARELQAAELGKN